MPLVLQEWKATAAPHAAHLDGVHALLQLLDACPKWKANCGLWLWAAATAVSHLAMHAAHLDGVHALLQLLDARVPEGFGQPAVRLGTTRATSAVQCQQFPEEGR